MKCVECNCTTTTFDERMGETICADCGLILSVNIFEETSKTIFIKDDGGVFSRTYDVNKLGSIIERKDVKSKTDYISKNPSKSTFINSYKKYDKKSFERAW